MSFRDYIVEQIYKRNKDIHPEAAITQVSSLFLDGVELDKKIFSQYRISLGISTIKKI